MEKSNKIALAVTLGFILGIVLFLLINTISKEIKERHTIEVQKAYDMGYVEGFKKGHEAGVSQTMDLVKKNK